MIDRLTEFAGIEQQRTGLPEKLVSAAGGFLSIVLLVLTSQAFADPMGPLLAASMGASAVLLFAVPHGPLSQPWPVFGGHLLSALLGVLCAKWLPTTIVAPAAAVGLSIGAMYFFRCLHPPGGATALFAVIGGVEHQGFLYVISPVLINTIVILAVAIAFNYWFPWRKYPVALMKRAEGVVGHTTSIRHESFVYALSQLDTFIDASEHDLLRIYDLALGREEGTTMHPDEIQPGRCYCNGRFGEDWWVRRVIDVHHLPESGNDEITYQTVAGKGRRRSGTMGRDEFARFVSYEVYRDEENWRRVERDEVEEISPGKPG